MSKTKQTKVEETVETSPEVTESPKTAPLSKVEEIIQKQNANPNYWANKPLKTEPINKNSPIEYNPDDTNISKRQSDASMIMGQEEAIKFLGERDPYDYFFEGVINKHLVKAIGDLLPEDRDEVKVLRRLLPGYDDVLMFKHRTSNTYTLVIPKVLSNAPLNLDREFIELSFRYDPRPVVFNGVGRPSQFDESYFKKWTDKFAASLSAARSKNQFINFNY